MKEILDAILIRMKSPFFGLTTLFYIGANIKIIATFIFVENQIKLKMIEDFSFDLTTLLWCSLIAILYVVISDWLQLGIDIAVTKARELRKIQAYKSQSKLVQAEYKSTKEYAAKLIDLGLENWLEDKNKLEHECDEAKNKYEVIQSEYDEIRKQLSFMSAEYKNKTRELRDQQRLAKDLLESTHKLGKYLEKFENDEMSSLAGLKASSDRAELFAPVLKKAEYMNSILQSNQEQVIKQDRQSNVNGGVGTEAVSLE